MPNYFRNSLASIFWSIETYNFFEKMPDLIDFFESQLVLILFRQWIFDCDRIHLVQATIHLALCTYFDLVIIEWLSYFLCHLFLLFWLRSDLLGFILD